MNTITDIHVDLVSTPLHSTFVTAQRSTDEVQTVVLRLADDQGRVGWGEGPESWRVTGESLAGIKACLEGPLAAVLVGANLDEWPHVLQSVQSAIAGNPSAKMAADLAVHDLVAQVAGVSVAELLGGPSGGRALPTDVTLSAGSVDDLVGAALARVGEGFTTLKLKVGADASHDLERIEQVRAAVGPDITLRVDANQGWQVDEAIAIIEGLATANLGIEAVEQPVRRRDLVGLVRVAAASALPVMADESVFDLDDLDDLARVSEASGGAIGLVNVKLAKCGGLAPARGVIDRARELGMKVLVGSMMESMLGMAAAGALVQATGQDLVPDLDAAWWGSRSAFEGGPAYGRGVLVLPDAPGFGVGGLTAS